jgi:SRSO17 transposase
VGLSGSAGGFRGCEVAAGLDEPGVRLGHRFERVEFQTKPEHAKKMIARALSAGVPFGWATADEAYGQAKHLQNRPAERDVLHVLTVRVTLADGSFAPVKELIGVLPEHA